MTGPDPGVVPQFPPLFDGVGIGSGPAPFETAIALAREGCDGGTIVHRLTADRLEAAMVFAPEVPLDRAVGMLIVCGVGFSNAFGALAPPEVAVHQHWDGRIRINGGLCGGLRIAAAPAGTDDVPDWLVVGLSLTLIPQNPDAPGATPDQTSLFDEGCAEVDPMALLEAWSRHTLVWINTWESGGTAALHSEWLGRVPDIGKGVADPRGGGEGTFLGVDEDFAMLLQRGDRTDAVPLTCLLADLPA